MENFAADIKEMMDAWNKIQEAARVEFPNASDKEIYQITSGAMRHAIERHKCCTAPSGQ